MKKTTSLIASSALLVAFFTAAPAQAQMTCDDIDFTGPQAQRFPELRNACLGVVQRDGRNFAKFTAELQRIAGTTVYAKFKLPDGGMSDTYKFDVPPDSRVTVDGRKYRYRDLGQGAEVNLYIPDDRWDIHVPESEYFATAATVAVATPALHDEDDDMVAALPKTASPLPLIGLMGGLLTSLGVLLYGVRRRFLKG